MTVIAWDGKTLAADRLRSNDNVVFESECKITSFHHGGALIAMASFGDYDVGQLLRKWVINGEIPNDFPEAADGNTKLVVASRNQVYAYSRNPVKLSYHGHSFFAWGSGNELALGALAAGATAMEAVKIAIKYSAWCGFGVDVADLTHWSE